MPIIILTDHVSKELIEILEELENSYCMVKPIDYNRLALLVENIVQNDALHLGGYEIV
ncbi:MAG TPA: hypothetical protein PLK94_05210 [Alphaproteobacteria bacterium]|nr:hypothetical protein [Alphaproteobacteria bacterium]